MTRDQRKRALKRLSVTSEMLDVEAAALADDATILLSLIEERRGEHELVQQLATRLIVAIHATCRLTEHLRADLGFLAAD